MQPSPLHYFPHAWPFLLILFGILTGLVVLMELRVLAYAYARMGIQPRYIFGIMLASLVGSSVNIPVAQIPGQPVVSETLVRSFGVYYVIPHTTESKTIVAVNLGGALIPTALSLYLLTKNRLYIRSVLAVIVVSLVVHHLAKPVPHLGISVPIFVPPLVAAGVAMLLSWRKAPALAYIAGSLGTLIGADLMNLGNLSGLHAPVASIGGAGTFDGVFLTGIIAVLLPPMGPEPDYV